MNTEIRVPAIPNAGIKLSIGRWFKRTGDAVTRDEPLVEINTDNVTHEVRAPVTGVLSDISFPDGAAVETGGLLGTIRQF
jgi:2-oxoglutarate dehydrogenase E2 component (dihydrolipoamide succinyltransferase)